MAACMQEFCACLFILFCPPRELHVTQTNTQFELVYTPKDNYVQVHRLLVTEP